MDLENHLNGKEFELVQVPHDHIKSEKEAVSAMQEENVKVEHNFDRNKSEVIQITHVFIKEEYGQCINTGLYTDAVSDRSNAPNKTTNFDHTSIRFEDTNKGVLKRHVKKIECQKDVDNNKYKVTEHSDQLIIKTETDEQSFINEDTELVSNRAAVEHDFAKPLIKCEAFEELKLENDLDIETCGSTESMITNDDGHILEQHRIHEIHKRNNCVHCNMTFSVKRNLDDHIVRKHPDFIAEVSSKIYACAHCMYKSTRKESLVRHLVQHSGAEGDYRLKKCIHCNGAFRRKMALKNHIIMKHPEHIASISGKIYECKHCVFKTAVKIHLVSHVLGKHPGAELDFERKTCIHCNASFASKVNLDDHMIKKHPEYIASVSNKIHKCKYCAFKTTKKSHLVKHMKYHGAESGGEPKPCIHCDGKFKDTISLDDHTIKEHPEFIVDVSSKIHACVHCTYRTTIKESLVQHMLKNSEAGDHKLVQCIHCNEKFRRKTSLDDHIIKKHPDYITSVSSKIHECKYCVFKTTSKYNLDRHMDKHSEAEGGCEPKSCVYCNATFKSKRNLDDHIIKNHPDFIAEVSSKIHECTHCTYKTARKDGLVRHLLLHSGTEDDYKLNKCVHCNGAFRRKTTLDDHIIKKHPGYISQISSKVHECVYCMYKTTIKGELANHMWKHPDFTAEVSAKIHACVHCAYKSTIKENLVKHMLKHPEAKGDYKFQKCVHCNGAFRHKTALDDHIIRKHPEHTGLVSRKIYECKYCVFKTTSKFNIGRHMGKHSETKGGSALKKCGHCDGVFRRNIALNNHIIKNHPEYLASISGKIHECKYCIYKTAVKSHLVGHMTGKHPRAGAEVGCERKMCIHCKAMFKDKINLDDHIIKKHPDFIVDVSREIRECAHCTYRTTIKKSLVRHMLKHPRTEGEYKPRKCVYCNEAFARKVSLNNHIITKHPEYIASISSKIHSIKMH